MMLQRCERILVHCGFVAGVSALMLAGCSNSGSLPGFASANTAPATGGARLRPARQRSWMEPDAQSKQLLYVSDPEANDVDVYSYPQDKLMGQLTGFTGVQGLCTDKTGNIWIASGETMLEYKHAGTKSIATLQDPGYLPTDCAVDPKTGNLAVANSAGWPSHSPGNLAIYTHAKGSPKVYANDAGGLCFMDYIGYDSAGNAFIDGMGGVQSSVACVVFELFELPKGASTLEAITTGVSGLAGGVAWDGKYITVGTVAPTASTIYRLKVKGSAAKTAGTTTISGNPGLGGYLILTNGKKQGDAVIDPEIGGTKDVGFFNYPSGTGPTKTITGLENPEAVAISK